MKKTLLIVFTIIILVVILLLLGGGCSIVKSRVARLTTDFRTFPSDNRIFYEDGAEKIAKETALHLNKAINDVESKQFGKFTEPVKIYVFATPESFSKFSGISDKAKGASVGSEVYLSGLMKDIPEEIYGMVGHELSHVQLSQNLGVITFNRSLPRWFREGLAIYVSSGGGAPRNYEEETKSMFLEGKHFVPESIGTLFNRNLNSTADIGPKMFYSQSGMFMTFLANKYPEKFEALLKGLQNGNKFKEQFNKSFGNDVESVLKDYISIIEKV